MSVCLCVSAYISLRWEEEERWQPGPAGQVELRNGQAVLPSPSLCWMHRTCIPTPSTVAPALPAGASPFCVPTSPACLGSVCVWGGCSSCPSPLALGQLPHTLWALWTLGRVEGGSESR